MRDNLENQKSHKLDLDQYLLIPIFLILLIIATTEARAEETSATTAQITEAKMEEVAPAAEAKKLSLALTLEHSSNLSSRVNPDRDESTSLIIQPKYIISEKSEIEARVDLVQNYDSERKTSTTNTAIILTPTRIELNKELMFEPQVSVALPTDKKFSDAESYQGSVAIRPTLIYSPENIKGLSILNRVSISKNFHQYEVNSSYSPNIEYQMRYRLAISYLIIEKLLVELVNDYSMGQTYNSYHRDIFYFAQSIGYEFKKDWAVALSHKNEGPATGPNNNGSNIVVYDEKSSYLALGVSHVF